MPLPGRIAAVAAAGIVVVITMWAIANSSDSKSYELGRKETLAAQAFYKGKCQAFTSCENDPEGEARKSCAHVINMTYGQSAVRKGLDIDDMIDGCMAGFDVG